MPLGIDFWEDFGGFWEPKWNQVGTNIEPKIHVNIEMRFSENRALTAVGVNFLDSGVQVGSKNRSKIDQEMKS